VNRDLLVHLASLVNGKNSRVVRKLHSISRLCLDSIEGMSDRCQLASTYNDCLNENMIEFAFPLDIAEEAVRKMPFHLIQPNSKLMIYDDITILVYNIPFTLQKSNDKKGSKYLCIKAPDIIGQEGRQQKKENMSQSAISCLTDWHYLGQFT
ncbi:jg20717, partial [Pararge aegeria aegeria]